MKRIIYYACDSKTPSDEELKQCIHIAQEEHCIVNLSWFFPYSGHYHVNVKEGMTFEECKSKLPKVYPV